MNRDRREFLTLGIGALAVAVLPRAHRSRPALVRRRIPIMGTVAEVAVPARTESWAHRAIDAAFAELRRVESSMTRFKADSDVGMLNATIDGWSPVSENTGAVLRAAARWAELSSGRFDPCLGRVSELWDVTRRETPPPRREFADFAGSGLWSALEVDMGASTPRARLDSRLAAVDLGGIAKGFAVDAAADALRGCGVFDGLVNVGGDLVALGTDPSGDPWRVGVRSPEAADAIVAVLPVSDEAVATSGDYVRFFAHGGRRYHHLLDPTTGAPYATATRSLTVRAERCIDADAAATSLFAARTSVAHSILERCARDVTIIHHLRERTT